MANKINPYCKQHFDILEMMEYGCSYKDCRHCGHNENVAKYRKRLIRQYGLTKCEDGLWRFLIPKWRRSNGSEKA